MTKDECKAGDKVVLPTMQTGTVILRYVDWSKREMARIRVDGNNYICDGDITFLRPVK